MDMPTSLLSGDGCKLTCERLNLGDCPFACPEETEGMVEFAFPACCMLVVWLSSARPICSLFNLFIVCV